MPNIHRLTWLRGRLSSVAGESSLSLFRSNPPTARRCNCLPSRLSISRFLALTPTGNAQLEHVNRLYRTAHEVDIPSARTDVEYNRIYNHVRTTPLLDILSVSVLSDECQKEQSAFRIYGTVKLIDVEQNHAYGVFRRTCRNPQTVLSGCELLHNPKGICTYLHVPSAPTLKMCVNLKDATANGKVIAKGEFDLQLFDHKDGLHERVVTEVVRGRNGNFVSVQYATLPYAVLATVRLSFTKIDATGSDQNERSHAHIYGCISASCKVRQGDDISSVLLNKTRCDPMMVEVGKPIQLTRPTLAVPAYSILQIKADLWDHQTDKQIASGVILIKCEAQDRKWVMKDCVLGENYHVRVKVRWDNAYVPQIAPDQQSSLALSYRGSLLANEELLTSSPKRSLNGSPMVEVFSVSISPDRGVNFVFCGTIEVVDNKNVGGYGNPFVMFKHNELDGVMLTSDMRIKFLKWPACPFEGESFYMCLELSDNVGHEVCSGNIDWDCGTVISPVSWYGKLISSVIRGKHGYATVHYAMFRNAVQAKVVAKFRVNNSSGFTYMIIGNVTGRYSCFTYSSDSEKKFFQINLLTHNSKSTVSGGSFLSFEKSAVAVPVDCSLILDLNLHVGVMGKTTEGTLFSKHYGSLNEVVDFKFDVGTAESRKSLAGEGFQIELIVRWKESDIYEKWRHYKSLESDLLLRCQQA